MNTNRYAVLTLGAVVLGVLCAFSVNAEPSEPKLERYRNLKDVEVQKHKANKYEKGLSHLSNKEHKYSEHLPMQLDGAIKSISAKKYQKQRSHQIL